MGGDDGGDVMQGSTSSGGWGWGSGSSVGLGWGAGSHQQSDLGTVLSLGEGQSPADLLPHLSAQLPQHLEAKILPLLMRLGETLRLL